MTEETSWVSPQSAITEATSPAIQFLPQTGTHPRSRSPQGVRATGIHRVRKNANKMTLDEFDSVDRKIMNQVHSAFPLVAEPYKEIANHALLFIHDSFG